MMSLQQMEQESKEAGLRAQDEEDEPMIYLHGMDIRAIPNLGDHRPNGWTLLRVMFVDKSGWGGEGEPALTLEAFLKLLVDGRAYAIIQEGQFQIHIGEFSNNGEIINDVDLSHRAVFSPTGW